MTKPVTGLVIHPDNTYEEVTINDYKDISKSIGCRVFCIVPNYFDRPYDMYGDDEALLRDESTIQWNGIASQYYGMFEHGQPIAGSVLVLGPVDEQGESTSLADEHMNMLKEICTAVHDVSYIHVTMGGTEEENDSEHASS